MVKKLLLFVVLTMMTMQVGAQNAFQANDNNNTIHWGYPDAPLNHFGMAYMPETIAMAIKVPGTLLEGSVMKGVSIVLPAPQDLKEAKVWASTVQPTDYATGDIINKTLDLSSVEGKKSIDILFDESYTITDQDFYVGYTFTQTDAFTDPDSYTPLWMYDWAKEVPGSFYLYTSTTFPMWFDMYGFNYGNAPIDLILDMTDCKAKGNVQVSEVGYKTVKTGVKPEIALTLTNNGGFVTDFDITTDVDGKKTTSHVVLDEPVCRLKESVGYILNIDALADSKVVPLTVSVDKVNGKTNAETVTNETEGSLIAISKEASRRSVLESFTTIDDDREVLAMASYPLLKKALGDKLIIINSHFSTSDETPDPMANEDYDELGFAMTGGVLPLYIIDRKQQTNPYYGLNTTDADGKYHFVADKVVNDVNSLASEADFKLQAAWTDETKNSITATAQTTFYLNSNDPLYTIGFVLTEDNVSYEGTKQGNALSADYEEDWGGGYIYKPENNKLFPDDDLAIYTSGSPVIENPVNDYIVRGAWGAKTGIDNSIEAIENNKQQVYSTTLNIENKKVLDKKNLKLVALLIRLLDGTIVNADEVGISEVPTGISTLNADSRNEERFTLDGRQLSAPAKGLNIVKMANGKVVKKFVK